MEQSINREKKPFCIIRTNIVAYLYSPSSIYYSAGLF